MNDLEDQQDSDRAGDFAAIEAGRTGAPELEWTRVLKVTMATTNTFNILSELDCGSGRLCSKTSQPDCLHQIRFYHQNSDCQQFQYLRTKQMNFLDGTIESTTKVLGLLNDNFPETFCSCISSLRSLIKAKLSARLDSRVECPDSPTSLEDLLRSISLDEELLREPIPVLPGSLPFSRCQVATDLGRKLQHLFKRRSDLSDLNKSVDVLTEAVQLSPVTRELLDLPQGAVIRASQHDLHGLSLPLYLLSVSLMERYLFLRRLEDLNRAIRLSEVLVRTVPDAPMRGNFCIVHATCLIRRYEREVLVGGNDHDLIEAISTYRIMLTCSFIDPRSESDAFHQCAYFLFTRHSQGHLPGLRELATDMVYRVHPQAHDNLARQNYDDNAEYIFRCAVAIRDNLFQNTPLDHRYRAEWLSNYLSFSGPKFSKWGGEGNRTSSIEIARKCLQKMSLGSAARSRVLYSLAVLLLSGPERQPEHLLEARHCWDQAMKNRNGFLKYRIGAGRDLVVSFVGSQDWNQAYEAAAYVVHLIPQMAPRILWEESDRQERIKRDGYEALRELPCEAATVALRAGRGPLAALELLETGRGLLASSFEEVRIENDDLETQYPELSREFQRLRNEVNCPESSMARRQVASRELDQVLQDIRKRSGFETFLAFPGELVLKNAAKDGPIAVINVSRFGCDAILVEYDRIRTVNLPDITRDDLAAQPSIEKTSEPEDFLEGLWDTITEPILKTLGFTEAVAASGKDWERIWWIPTGILSKLPIHAAGYHNQSTGKTVLDRIMSSYTASIRALIQSRRRQSSASEGRLSPQPTQNGLRNQALLVAMPETSGHRPLEFSTREIDVVRSFCNAMKLFPVEPTPCKKAVLDQLGRSHVFHFAGHGRTDPVEPSRSSLLLQDWQSDGLTVASIQALNIRKGSSPPFLAYLSACGTGSMSSHKNVRLPPDESVDLISAFQLIGFRHVIGTLWDVGDASCAEAARITYHTISTEMSKNDGEMTDRAVCLGLHESTLALRDKWRLGLRRLDDEKGLIAEDSPQDQHKLPVTAQGSELSHLEGLGKKKRHQRGDLVKRMPAFWAPYVHYGA